MAKTRNWDYARAVTTACSYLKVRTLDEAGRRADAEREEAQEDERMLRGLISTGSGGGDEEVLDTRRNFDRLSAVLDLKGGEPLAIRALGALLLHLQTTIFQLEPGGLVPVQALERFDLNRYVRLDSNAFSSLQVVGAPVLFFKTYMHKGSYARSSTRHIHAHNTNQIFAEERHPNVISGRGRSKEGFSLFALLDQTRSRPGRACLREWMLRPLRQPEAIVRRQRAIDLLVQVCVAGLLYDSLCSSTGISISHCPPQNRARRARRCRTCGASSPRSPT